MGSFAGMMGIAKVDILKTPPPIVVEETVHALKLSHREEGHRTKEFVVVFLEGQPEMFLSVAFGEDDRKMHEALMLNGNAAICKCGSFCPILAVGSEVIEGLRRRLDNP